MPRPLDSSTADCSTLRPVVVQPRRDSVDAVLTQVSRCLVDLLVHRPPGQAWPTRKAPHGRWSVASVRARSPPGSIHTPWWVVNQAASFSECSGETATQPHFVDACEI